MVERIERYFIHNDERGTIEGIINKGCWKEINIITSSGSILRGGHYHKETQEMFIILDGEVIVKAQKVENGKLTSEVMEFHARTGDVFIVNPNVVHTFQVEVYSKWLNALSKIIDPKNPDIHRIRESQ